MDFSNELMNWSRRGVFMYSSVHPKAFVLYDVARQLFAKAGLKARELDYEYYAIHDLARSEIFPIYPAIAEHFGTIGGYLFKMRNCQLSQGIGDFLNLPQYLSASYKIYQNAQAMQIDNARVRLGCRTNPPARSSVQMARENLRACNMLTL